MTSERDERRELADHYADMLYRLHGVLTSSGLTAADDLLASDWLAAHDARVRREAKAEALRDMADRIDRGPGIPLPPSVYSALVRERAEDIERGETDD